MKRSGTNPTAAASALLQILGELDDDGRRTAPPTSSRRCRPVRGRAAAERPHPGGGFALHLHRRLDAGPTRRRGPARLGAMRELRRGVRAARSAASAAGSGTRRPTWNTPSTASARSPWPALDAGLTAAMSLIADSTSQGVPDPMRAAVGAARREPLARTAASRWRSWGRRARARARCCTSSARSTGRRRARSRSTAPIRSRSPSANWPRSATAASGSCSRTTTCCRSARCWRTCWSRRS